MSKDSYKLCARVIDNQTGEQKTRRWFCSAGAADRWSEKMLGKYDDIAVYVYDTDGELVQVWEAA